MTYSILSQHVASVESLKPGMLEVFEGTGAESKKWFGTLHPVAVSLPTTALDVRIGGV